MQTPAKFTAIIALAAAIFFAGYLANRRTGPAASAAPAGQVLYYTCPMHPQYKSDHPGDAPCCGMTLVPVYAGSTSGGAAPRTSDDRIVQVSSAAQQLIGVRTEEVKRADASHLFRVPGRVAVDEARLFRVIAAVDGWIRELGPNPAGSFVKKDQILASYYAQNFQAAQQALLLAVNNGEQLTRGQAAVANQRLPIALNVQVAIDTLRSLGMSDRQITEIQRTNSFASEINIYSPVSGFVLARNVSPQQRFDKGTELYRIADIGRVWVTADVFEKDRQFLKPGAMATVRYDGREFQARLTDSLLQLDPQVRTLKARFEVANPGYVLQPDAFVEVQIHVDAGPEITVPADAVIDTGLRRTVFVDSGSGAFEPRLIETGRRFGDRIEVTKGLEPGERIVISGNFLLDSESRMKVTAVTPASVTGDVKAAKDPVCGMDVDSAGPHAIRAQHGGKAHFFCSDQCRKKFEANPERYLPKAIAAQERSGRRGPG